MRWPYEQIGVTTARAFRNLLNKIIGDIGADMQEHKDRADNIQAQVDNLVADGDSSPEAAQARVGADGTNYTTLKQRLDAEHADVTAQLADKLNKGEVSVADIDKNRGKFDQTYMSDEFLQQIAGNTPINATPAPGSIIEEMFADNSVSSRTLALPNRLFGTVEGSKILYFDWDSNLLKFNSTSLTFYYNDNLRSSAVKRITLTNLASIDISSSGWIYMIYVDITDPSNPLIKKGNLNDTIDNAVILAVYQYGYTINQLSVFGNKDAWGVKKGGTTFYGFSADSDKLNYPRRLYGVVDQYTPIVFDWVNKKITFPKGKVTFTYNDIRNAIITNVDVSVSTIDVSGLDGYGRMLYVDLSDNTIKVDYVTAYLNNIVILCYFIPYNADVNHLATFGRRSPFSIYNGETTQIIEYPPFYKMLKYRKSENDIKGVPDSLKNVYFSGRWYPSNFNGEQGMQAIQQGVEVYFKVRGTTSITALMKDTTGSNMLPPILSYKLDDADWVRVVNQPGFIDFPIATGLDTHEHYVRIMVSSLYDNYWTNDTGVIFTGVQLDEGAELIPIKPKCRTFGASGDSITAGKLNWKAEDAADGVTGTLAGSRAEKGYINIAADYLKSRVINNSFGGTGVVRSLNTANAVVSIDNLRDGVPDNNDYNLDFYVVNHGTNDKLSESEGITPDQFITNYKILLDRIIHRYPGIPIFTVIPFGQYYAQEIRDIANSDEYKDVCIIVETADWNLTYTDGLHPDSAGCQKAGKKLADFIISTLGSDYFMTE